MNIKLYKKSYKQQSICTTVCILVILLRKSKNIKDIKRYKNIKYPQYGTIGQGILYSIIYTYRIYKKYNNDILNGIELFRQIINNFTTSPKILFTKNLDNDTSIALQNAPEDCITLQDVYILPNLCYKDPFYAKFQQIIKASSDSFVVIMNQLREKITNDTQFDIQKQELNTIRTSTNPFPHINFIRYSSLCRIFTTIYLSSQMEIFSRIQLCITSRFMNTDQILKATSLQRRMNNNNSNNNNRDNSSKILTTDEYIDDISIIKLDTLFQELECANLDFLDIPYQYHTDDIYRILCGYIYDSIQSCTIDNDPFLNELLHDCNPDWLQKNITINHIYTLITILRQNIEEGFLFTREKQSNTIYTKNPCYIKKLKNFIDINDKSKTFTLYDKSLRKSSTSNSYIIESTKENSQSIIKKFHTTFNLNKEKNNTIKLTKFIQEESLNSNIHYHHQSCNIVTNYNTDQHRRFLYSILLFPYTRDDIECFIEEKYPQYQNCLYDNASSSYPARLLSLYEELMHILHSPAFEAALYEVIDKNFRIQIQVLTKLRFSNYSETDPQKLFLGFGSCFESMWPISTSSTNTQYSIINTKSIPNTSNLIQLCKVVYFPISDVERMPQGEIEDLTSSNSNDTLLLQQLLESLESI